METELLSEGNQVLELRTQIYPSLSSQNVWPNDSGASWILPRYLFPVFPPGTAHCWMVTYFLGNDGETGQHTWSSFRKRKCDSHPSPQTLPRSWPSLVPLLLSSSSLPRHLDPSLVFHRRDIRSVPAFTDSLLLGGQLLAQRYKHALFSKPFPISGGGQSATAGTTAAFG